MKLIAILFIITFFLQGCTYAISPETADKADKSIAYDSVQADPESFKDKLVIFGGTIAQLDTVDRGTLIIITQKPLDYWGKPERTGRTGGRFLAFYPGHLNELAYAPGVDITIAGEVLGAGNPLLGGRVYDDPVILVKEHKLWEREPRSQDKPKWMDPLYDPNTSRGRE